MHKGLPGRNSFISYVSAFQPKTITNFVDQFEKILHYCEMVIFDQFSDKKILWPDPYIFVLHDKKNQRQFIFQDFNKSVNITLSWKVKKKKTDSKVQ